MALLKGVRENLVVSEGYPGKCSFLFAWGMPVACFYMCLSSLISSRSGYSKGKDEDGSNIELINYQPISPGV